MNAPQSSNLQAFSVVHAKPEQMDMDACAVLSSLGAMHVAVAGTRSREGDSLESHSSYYTLSQQNSSMISTPATSPAFGGRGLDYEALMQQYGTQGINTVSGVVVTLPFNSQSSPTHATPISPGLYNPPFSHPQMINIQAAIKPQQPKRRRASATTASATSLRRTKDGGIAKSRSCSFSHHQQHLASRSMTISAMPFPSSTGFSEDYTRPLTSSPPPLLPSPLPSPPSSAATTSASSMMDILPTQMTHNDMMNGLIFPDPSNISPLSPPLSSSAVIADRDQNLPSPTSPPTDRTIFIREPTLLSPKLTSIKRESPPPSLLPNMANPTSPRGSQPSKGKKQSNSGHGSAQAPSIAHLASLTSHEPVTSTRNGVEWVNFYYSHNRVLKQYSVRVDIESVELSAIPEDFKALNCVYPRANLPRHAYAGNRWNYETECNALGWRLAYLNRDEIAGKRGLIQRAVDSYRNRYPSMRSRRVARQEKLVNGTLRKRKGRDGDPVHVSRGTHHAPGLPNGVVHAAAMDLTISTEEPADDIPVKNEPQDITLSGSASPTSPSSVNSDIHTYSTLNDEINHSKPSRRLTLPLLAPAPPRQQELCYVVDPATAQQDSITKLERDYQNNESKPFYEYQKTLGMKESAPIFHSTISDMPIVTSPSSCSQEEMKAPTNLNETMQPWTASPPEAFPTHIRIKINVDDVDLNDITEEFRRANCVYPRAAGFLNSEMNSDVNDSNNKGIKSECNVLGWKLAWLNPEYLANKKTQLQRVLDLYRMNYAPHLFPRRASSLYRCDPITSSMQTSLPASRSLNQVSQHPLALPICLPSKVWNPQTVSANAIPVQMSPSTTEFSTHNPSLGFPTSVTSELGADLDQGFQHPIRNLSGQVSLSLNLSCPQHPSIALQSRSYEIPPQQNDPPGTPDYDDILLMHDDEENVARSVSTDNPTTTSLVSNLDNPNHMDFTSFQSHLSRSTRNNSSSSSNFAVHRDSGFSEASIVTLLQKNDTTFPGANWALNGVLLANV